LMNFLWQCPGSVCACGYGEIKKYPDAIEDEYREEIKDFIPDSRFRVLLTRMKIGDILGFTNGNRHYALMRDE
jgi:hypothetical protein